MIWYRHADPRYPFLWESADQPPARWHGEGEGPAHYLSDTAEGAWAEYLRHEEITELDDLRGIRRSIWAVEVPAREVRASAMIPVGPAVLGGLASHQRCRRVARKVRRTGHSALRVAAAALVAGGAHGWHVDGGTEPAPDRTAMTLVLFGRRPDLVGWSAAHIAQPDPHILPWYARCVLRAIGSPASGFAGRWIAAVPYLSRPVGGSPLILVDLDETEHTQVIVRGTVRLGDEAEVGIPPLGECRLARGG